MHGCLDTFQTVTWKRYNDFNKLYKSMFSLHKALHRREEFPDFVRAKLFSMHSFFYLNCLNQFWFFFQCQSLIKTLYKFVDGYLGVFTLVWILVSGEFVLRTMSFPNYSCSFCSAFFQSFWSNCGCIWNAVGVYQTLELFNWKTMCTTCHIVRLNLLL